MPQLTPATNTNLVQDDGRWRGDTGNPVYPNETIAIDKSAFTGTWTGPFVPSGVAVAQLTATKLYVPYNTGGSGGAEVFKGLLYNPVAYGKGNAAGDDLLGTLFVGGTVFMEFLPVQSAGLGFVDGDAITAAPLIKFIPKPA